MASNNNNAGNTSTPNNQQQLSNLSSDDINQMMAQVQWQGEAKETFKTKLKHQRSVAYRVEGIGVVTEEWKTSAEVTGEHVTNPEVPIYLVFVDGQLVRQVNLKTKEVLKSESKYEPYSFLHYGPAGSTEKPAQVQPTTDKVPVLNDSSPAKDSNKDDQKNNGSSPKKQ